MHEYVMESHANTRLLSARSALKSVWNGGIEERHAVVDRGCVCSTRSGLSLDGWTMRGKGVGGLASVPKKLARWVGLTASIVVRHMRPCNWCERSALLLAMSMTKVDESSEVAIDPSGG